MFTAKARLPAQAPTSPRLKSISETACAQHGAGRMAERQEKRGGLAEQAQQHLRPLIGQAQGLDAKLLASL